MTSGEGVADNKLTVLCDHQGTTLAGERSKTIAVLRADVWFPIGEDGDEILMRWYPPLTLTGF